MRSVAEHQAVVARLIAPSPHVVVPLAEAAGRVLAVDQVAAIDLPSFDNSAMDGYAVRSADVAAASAETPVRLPVDEDVPAGRGDGPPLAPASAHRIMTGAPIPLGADAVVQVELTDGGTSVVEVREPRTAGANIRRAGEDVRVGDRVLAAGTLLGPAQLGLLAALGCATVSVHAPLRVLVLSTGSELAEAGAALLPGQVHDANGPMLAAAVEAAGARASRVHFVADDVAQLHASLEPHLAQTDLVVTSGGISAGAYEVVKDALAEDDVEFVKVAMQPGMPQGAGRYRGTPILTFPGNPISSLVSFEVFLREPLRAAMGFPEAARPRVRARLAEPLDAPAGKRQFRRGQLSVVDGDAVVCLVGPPGSHFLRSLAAADCLVDVPEHVTHLDADDEVDVWRL